MEGAGIMASGASTFADMYVGLIMIAVIVIAAARGWSKGLAAVLWSFIVIVISFVGTKLILIYLVVSQKFSAIAFLVAIVIFYLILSAIGTSLKLIDKIPILRSVNKGAGLVVGLLLGYTIVQVVLYFAGLMEGMGLYTEFFAQHVDADPLVNMLRTFDIFALIDKLKQTVNTVSELAA